MFPKTMWPAYLILSLTFAAVCHVLAIGRLQEKFNTFQAEAIEKGFAHYAINKHGKLVFEWNDHL